MIERVPGTSRSDLASALGFSEMAATRIVRELLAAGLVEEFESPGKTRKKKRSVGRPKTGLRIVPARIFAVGITVSAYHSEVSICDAAGEIRANRMVLNPPFETPESAARVYAEAVRLLIEEADVDLERIIGIGIALSARTDPDRCEILRSEYFGWANDGGRFCSEIRKFIDLPIEIENIANALAIAEMRFGAAREASAFALVHAATFVGASIVSENRIVRGATGVSGLIGHFRSTPTELTCVCGRSDCLNLNATGFGVLGRLGLLDEPSFDNAHLSYYAGTLLEVLSNQTATGLVSEAGACLAPAIDNIGKLLGPEMVIVSGQLGSDAIYFDGVKRALETHYDLGSDAAFRLVRGTIRPERSAALLALHTFCYSDRLDYDRLVDTAAPRSSARG
ncbi:ROK family transcriptional regulator [Marimonas sp. MJW-29]|uniref:ROK family transcriptional regulator n=1 Tax=Sulfitobacter sediminis TaxID=3234186 RepID=A0ABV3RQR8_9RHOB